MICATCLVRGIVDWSAVSKHSLGAPQNGAAPSTSPSLRPLNRVRAEATARRKGLIEPFFFFLNASGWQSDYWYW